MFSALFRSFQRRSSQRASRRLATRSFRPSLEGLENRVQLSASPASLGAAGQFAALEINGGTLTLLGSTVTGDVALGPNGRGDLHNTSETGTFTYDPTAKTGLSKKHQDFLPTGGIVSNDLTQAQADANAASAADAALTPTVTLGNVTKSLTLLGNGGSNVISVQSLNYRGDTLTLSGGANDTFVFNVTGAFHFARSTMVLTGGVTANHVLFNFPTAGGEIDLSRRASVIDGTFLAPQRTVRYHNAGSFNGAVIAHNVDLDTRANLVAALFSVPTVSAAAISGVVTTNGGDGPVGMAGVQVTLSGTDAQGRSVTLTVTTDGSGAYSFTGVAAGTYMLTAETMTGYSQNLASAGTVNGQVDGLGGSGVITQIVLNGGDAGINYNFREQFGSGGGQS
jgi:uncharacterized lipoprotein NlpE involved in copper resistance